MSKELKLNSGESGLSIHFSPEKIELLKSTVAKGATDTELEQFIYLAQRYNLDPFTNEIWFIKRAKKVQINGNWDYRRLQNGEIDYTGAETTIMTSRDGYLKIGQADPQFKELNSMEIRANDNFSYNPMTKEIKHEIGANRGAITGAWAICSRKDREPAVIIVDFQEYKKAVGKSSTWDKYPSAMIRKVAEVIVLKRQFNISGLVTREEMAEQYNYTPEPERERKDITPTAVEIPPMAKEKNNVIPLPTKDPQPSQEQINAEWKKYSHKINEKREMLALSPSDLKDLLLKTLGLNEDPKKWSLKEIKSAYLFLDDLSKPATYGLDKEEAAEIDQLFPLPHAKLDNEIQQTETKQESFNLISNYN